MAISLYDLSVPTFLQTTRAVSDFLARAARHCAQTGADPDDFVRARLYPDMAPFHFQIEALTHHAVWGVEAVKTGVFAPPPLVGAMPFAKPEGHGRPGDNGAGGVHARRGQQLVRQGFVHRDLSAG